MKHTILMILSVLALAGCRDESQQQSQQQEQVARQVETERQQRVAAEKHAEDSDEKRSQWQSVAFVFGIGAVLLLVIGTSLGSAAKSHVKPRD